MTKFNDPIRSEEFEQDEEKWNFKIIFENEEKKDLHGLNESDTEDTASERDQNSACKS
jgi:hypothetical protein